MKTVKLSSERESDVVIGRGALGKVGELFDLNRRVLVLTDREVPKEYVDAVALKCLYPVRISVWPGEATDTMDNYERICEILAENSFSESDLVVSVGGARVLALGAFIAATYLGGIEHCAVPTTFASQIGNGFFGRKCISLVKGGHVLGTTVSPRRVIVDAELLRTLDQKRMANGYAEVIRLGLALDKKLFEYLENQDLSLDKSIDFIVSRAIEIKNYVYRKQKEDPTLVRALELGNIIADGMEKTNFSFGERLAIGMLPMCSADVKIRLRPLLSRVGLPAVWQYDVERLYRDSLKGNEEEKLSVVTSSEIGNYKVDKITIPEYYKMIKSAYGG